MQVTQLASMAGNKHKCVFTDGSENIRGILASQFAQVVADGQLKNGSVVILKSYVPNRIESDFVLMTTDLEVLSDVELPVANNASTMDVDCEVNVALVTPNTKKPNTNQNPVQIGRASGGMTPPAPSPSEA